TRIKYSLSGIVGENSKLSRFFLLDFKLKPRQVNAIFGLSLLSNAATFFSCFLLALSVDLGISFLHVSGGVAVAGLLNLLPITIMGLGTREVSLLYLFQGVNPEKIMAFSFMMFLTLQVAGGVLSLLMGQLIQFLKFRSNKHALKN
ncbi:MAG: flippase-like domain-containing protein, partial [Bacteroidales bacterium]|nr:flippase-like domain-containing protein [Bacteroidales bacterium]